MTATTTTTRPRLPALLALATAQASCLTSRQARACGFSKQLLTKMVARGELVRLRRGVLRVVGLPAPPRPHLVALWLWSGDHGVFHGRTALTLLGLWDDPPEKPELYLPSAWRDRRSLRLPKDATIDFVDVPGSDRARVGPLPVTSAARTLGELLFVAGQSCSEGERAADRRRLRELLALARGTGLVTFEENLRLKNEIAYQLAPLPQRILWDPSKDPWDPLEDPY